jgi:CubicO group peptidase (beta-lactamase class C family)
MKSILKTLAFVLMSVGAASAAPTTTPPLPTPSTIVAPATTSAAPAAQPQAHELTAADLESFLDGMVPYAINRADIAGATVSVVQDGKLLFAKGYGLANVNKRTPVVADQTLFRPGSISKLFTWTSVMQLVEQHKLDLDTDVNTYLDFKVPEKFGKPITLRNIMTHSSGFEETITDLFVNKPDELYPLRDYLIKRMPERIFPPGKVVAYSNYATAMAGYIVQRVSGEPFDQYVANHIFKPLAMNNSTFVQPLPKTLVPQMANGYKLASDSDNPIPFELVEAAPAGALSSTATDMARFMLAHLGNGTFDGAQILKPETIKEMQTPQGLPLPGMNDMALGFYEESRNGHHIIGHAGDTEGFHSDLHLILDQGVGIFMSFNSTGTAGAAEGVRVTIYRNFLDRYFPNTPADEATLKTAKDDAAKVVGYYRASRRKDSAMRVVFMLGQSQVSANSDGTINVDALKNLADVEKKWREVGPLTYREVNGQAHLKFVTDENGNVSYWTTDEFIPVFIFQKTSGLEQLSMLKYVGGAFLALLVATLLIWIGGIFVRRHYGRPLVLEPLQSRLRLASRLGVVAYLAMVAGWVVLFSTVMNGISAIVDDVMNPWYTILYVLGVLAIVGSLAIIANAILRLVRGPGGIVARAGEALLAVAAVYGIWLVLDLGLANFAYNF